METTGVEPVVPCGRRIYSPLGLPIFLHLPNFLVDRPGFEPGTEACKATVFPTIPTAHIMATPKGFEPLTFGFGDQRSAGLNYGATNTLF